MRDDWTRAGVGPKLQPDTDFDVLVVTTRRWALFLGRLAALDICANLTGFVEDDPRFGRQTEPIHVRLIPEFGRLRAENVLTEQGVT